MGTGRPAGESACGVRRVADHLRPPSDTEHQYQELRNSMRGGIVAILWLVTCTLCVEANVYLQTGAYSTNFSTVDDMWQYDTGCFDCTTKEKDECTLNTKDSIRPASIAQNAGLTITTRASNITTCSPTAGGSSGHLTFKPAVSFGTIRVKSRYFPESEDAVKTAKGFIGLEDKSSGAITITIHGKGATASGAPRHADWTRYLQSSCYQHGNNHNKAFSELDSSVNVANNYNWYEVTWTPASVTIKVNGKVARTVTGANNVPQKPLHVRLHARSIAYSEMPASTTFTSYIQEFHYAPLNSSLVAPL